MHTERELKICCPASDGTRPVYAAPGASRIKVVTDIGDALQGLSNDFCKQGMAFYIPRSFEIGQLVRVEFRLPDSRESMSVSARVRDCDGFRCGVEFQELDTTDEILLSDCCSKLSALLSGPRSTRLLFPPIAGKA
jgi:hypothetical protein